jgi:hypothetical protein
MRLVKILKRLIKLALKNLDSRMKINRIRELNLEIPKKLKKILKWNA